MDEFLNELYGTSEILTGEDVEKQAAAEFLIKMAEAEGVDLDTLSDDEVAELLDSVNEDMGKMAAAEPTPEVEAQEKLAEADFLGRAMAHAYVNELNEIEKEAGVKEVASKGYQALKKGLSRAGEWTGVSGMRAAHKGMRAAKKERAQFTDAIRGLKAKGDKRTPSMVALGKKLKPAAEDAKTYKGLRGEYAKQFGKRVGLPAAGLAAVGGGAAALSSSEKKSFDETFEDAAQERAFEMLAEAGYDVEKIAEADIQAQVEERALQMLEEAGYPVE